MMDEVTVNRDRLLEVLKVNREKHHDLFVAAEIGYKAAAIARLEEMLVEAREGKEIQRYLNLDRPDDHTNEYDLIISMAEMSVDKELTLSDNEFQRYVMDQWSWSKGFSSSCSSYSSYAASSTKKSPTPTKSSKSAE